MKKSKKLLEKSSYISPDIKVVEIETEQNILAAASADNIPAFEPIEW